MTAVLVIRPSSLGDIVHALSLVADVRTHRPDCVIDWVAEEGFVPLVALDPRVRRIIPVALRRWRRRPFAAQTWREMARFRRDLRRERYDVVLDLQEQVKGALIARLARGERHGPDRASIREPVATFLHDVHHRIERAQHFIDRCRALAAAALGYRIEGPPRFRLQPPPVDRNENGNEDENAVRNVPGARAGTPAGVAAGSERSAVFVHATSREDKLWPEGHWRALIAAFAASGRSIILPWGSDEERRRSERLAAGFPAASVPSKQTLPAIAALLARAELVVGVDTGLVHLAAALGTPTISLFVATDPARAGVARASVLAIDLGGVGSVPSVSDVHAAVETLRMRRARGEPDPLPA